MATYWFGSHPAPANSVRGVAWLSARLVARFGPNHVELKDLSAFQDRPVGKRQRGVAILINPCRAGILDAQANALAGLHGHDAAQGKVFSGVNISHGKRVPPRGVVWLGLQ